MLKTEPNSDRILVLKVTGMGKASYLDSGQAKWKLRFHVDESPLFTIRLSCNQPDERGSPFMTHPLRNALLILHQFLDLPVIERGTKHVLRV